MPTVPTLPGITSKTVDTARIQTHVLFSGDKSGEPVLFLHGNASSSTFWEEIMLMLPEGFHGISPDLRGYGDTEDKLIDATRGADDWVDDILSLMGTLEIEKTHAIGHSLGGTLVFHLIATAPERFLSGTVVNPGSPYGFGSTKDIEGTPCYEDYAGSGGGIVNPEFAKLLAEGDRSSDNPQASPRVVLDSFYWKPPFIPDREEDLLSSMLTEKVGADKYPGDFVSSANWPYVAPGKFGPINAHSPKYLGDSVKKFIASEPKPFILWIRSDSDQIVSDNSFFDFGALGKMGHIPDWPGEEIYPPQPMISQTRHVLEQYGNFEEVLIAGTGHTPFIEKPAEFMAAFKRVIGE